MKRVFFATSVLLMLTSSVLSASLVQGQPLVGTVKPGGTLVISLHADPGTLVPAISTSTPLGSVQRHFYEALIELDLNLEPVPGLAQSWEESPDHLTMTFHLVRNATWSDGVPFTSADVKFSYENLLGKYHPRTPGFMKYIKSIETPDDYTVVFKLNTEYGPFYGFMTNALTVGSIMPKHIWEKSVDSIDAITANPAALKPIGTGPFLLEEYAKGDHLTLVRNPHYWQKDLPYLDRIVYKIIPDSVMRAVALEAGEIDVISHGQMPQSEVARLTQEPGFHIAVKPSGHEGGAAFEYLFMNTKRKPFDNVLVRQAIAYAIDKNLMIDRAVFGLGLETTGPISQNLKWAYNPDVPNYPYDPKKAEELLDAAGYPRRADGTRFTVEWSHDTEEYDHVKCSEIGIQMLKAVGIDVIDVPMEVGAFEETLFTKWDFDLAVSDAATLFDPELGVRRMYDSTLATHRSYTGPTGYDNATVNELFDKAAMAIDKNIRGEYYKKMSVMVMQDLPLIQLFEKIQVPAMRSDVLNVPSYCYDLYMNSYRTVGWRAPEVVTTTQITTPATVTQITTPATVTQITTAPIDYTMYYIGAVVILIVVVGAYAYTKRKTK